MSFDAIVLCGGQSRRMGVPDKTDLPVGGRSLLDRVLDAVAGAERVVVVGDRRSVDAETELIWAREDPPGGGPAAALAAGLEHVAAPEVVVLAGDLPFVTRADVARLREARVADGAVYVDAAGREQWLCGVWSTQALRSTSLQTDASLRSAVGGLDIVRVASAGAASPSFDCDTPEDLRRAEELLS